jgi:hypothetical protein
MPTDTKNRSNPASHLRQEPVRTNKREDSTRHRKVIRNDRQTSRDVPIQLEVSDGESPQEPEVFQGDPRVGVVRERPLITSRGRRFKSCPHYKEKRQVRAGFRRDPGTASCFPEWPLSATCPQALPRECSSLREWMRLDSRGWARNLQPDAVRPPTSARDGLGLAMPPNGSCRSHGPLVRRQATRLGGPATPAPWNPATQAPRFEVARPR